MNGTTIVLVRRPSGVTTAASQPRATAWSAIPVARIGRPPIRSARMPGDRGDDDRHPRPRQRAQAGLERAVALDDLEELGEQEDRAEHPEVHQQRDRVRGAEGAAAEEAHRQHRVGVAGLPDDEADEQRGPGGERRDDLRAAPAEVVAVDDAPHEGQQAGADEAEARDVEAALRPVGSRSGGSTASGMTTRPIGTLSQKIQCQSRPSAMAPPTSGPMAIARPAMPPQAPSATARRSGGTAADRIVSVSGVTIAPPTPWMARARIRTFGRRRQRGERRTADEDRHPDQEHPLATEPVAERGAGDEQDREGQRVGVDHPLEVGQATRRGRA